MKQLFRNKKALIAVGVLIAAAICAVFVFRSPMPAAPSGAELIVNGDCEREGAGWMTDAWVKTEGYTAFSWTDAGEGADGGRALKIRNDYANDARFWQEISVEPNSLYRISGKIRARCAGGWGANLSVDGVYVFSNQVFDSAGEWVEAVLWGRTGPEQKKLRVFARLGGYSGEAEGEAYFDNISVMKMDALPQGAVAQNVYAAAAPAVEEDTEATAAAVLAAVCGGYVLLAALLIAWFRRPSLRLKNEGTAIYAVSLCLMCVLAAVIRILCALRVTGYDVDVNDFRIWADTAANTGLTGFYGSQGFCDYPPGYIAVLWLVGMMGRAAGGTSVLMVKMPAILADIATAVLLYRLSAKKDMRRAILVSALYLFNPLTVLVGSAWGQCDSVMTFFLVLTAAFAVKNKWRYALPAYMAAVLIKPQALLFGPLGLLALFLAGRKYSRVAERSRAFRKDLLTGIGLLAAVFALVVTPFAVGQGGLKWVFDLYGSTMGSYGYATVNSCNLYFLLGLNWANADTLLGLWGDAAAALLILIPLLLLVPRTKSRQDRVSLAAVGAAAVLALVLMRATGLDSCGNVGALVIVVAVIVPGIFLSVSGRVRHLPLCGAASLAMIFAGGAMMHERYLFPAAALLLLAYIVEKDKRILLLLVAVTVSSVLNCGAVLDRNIRIGGSAGHLSAPLFSIESDMAVPEYISAALNVLSAAALMALTGEICLCPERVKALEPFEAAEDGGSPGKWRLRVTDKSRAGKGFFNKRDGVLILAVSVLFSVLTFVNLGSTKAPQTDFVFLDDDQSVLLDLGEEKEFRLLYYQGIHYTKIAFTVETAGEDRVFSETGGGQVTEGDCFKWAYVKSAAGGSQPGSFSGRYIRITASAPGVTFFEILARSAGGEVYPLTLLNGADGAEKICDEPDTLEGEPGWYNSAYFDEIYHARTGYEILRGDMPIYEWTHPPLGKLLIALSVSVFGMTPFGWRFPGALMGVAMLPAVYLIAVLLLRKRIFALGAVGLMFFDCMHFTQTRIATIDSYVVCFILWAVFFMLYWFRLDYWRVSQRRSLTLLFLSGLFMALSIASKWTGCYCGAGLAVIYFWGMFRRLKEARMAAAVLKEQASEKAEKDAQEPKEENDAQPAAESIVGPCGVKRIIKEIACCFLFFILVPLAVYYMSYIPVLHYEHDFSVARIVEECRRMYVYHSQPGLGMDHPFYSPWYEWLVIGKPMWYDAAQYLKTGLGESITAMGNPAVWYLGSASVLGIMGYILYDLSEKREHHLEVSVLILIAYMAQFLPWVLVPRGTYIYHYFASVPFSIIANVFLWAQLEKKKPRWGRAGLLVQMVLAVALFAAFFPYTSGVAAPVEWMKAMQWFPNWLYFSAGTM